MLKKVLMAFGFIACCLILWWGNNMPVFSSYATDYEVYKQSASSSAQIVRADIITCPFISGKTGESCKIDATTFNTGAFLGKFNAKVVFTEKVDNVTCIYAYSPKVKYSTIVNGKKVNLHLAFNGDEVTLGTPLIYGGY